jgi:excisionase family DNA binding protein
MSIPSPTEHGDLLTTAEAAKLLKVSPVTIARWKKQGILPAYKLGPRAVRFRRDEVEALARPVTVANESFGRHPRPARPLTPYQHDPSVINHELRASIKPLTEEEKREALAWMDGADKLRERIRAERGGKPLPDSWLTIRAAREAL